MYQERLLNAEAGDVVWNPVDPEEDAIDPGNEPITVPPGLNTGDEPEGDVPTDLSGFAGPAELPKSLNEELEEKIKDDPNRFLGCGG